MPALYCPLNLTVDLFLLAVFSGVFLNRVHRWVADRWVGVLVSCSLGLILFSYLVFFLGLLSLLYASVLWVVIAILAAMAIRPLREFYKNRSIAPPRLERLEMALLTLLLASALFKLWFGYAPPTGEDELAYHISLPLLYAKSGRLVSTPFLVQSFFYLNGEMIFTGLLMLRDVFAVKAMVWLTGLLVSIALYVFARQSIGLDRKYALLTVLVVYSAPMMTSLHGTSSVDLINYFLEIVTVSLYWEWCRTPKRALVILMGILAGAAIGYRNYAASWVAAVFLMMVLLDRRWRDAVLFGTFAVCLFSPWVIRNFVLTGNPFYPSALWRSAAADPYHMAMAHAITPLTYLRELLVLPHLLAGGTFLWDFGLIPIALAPLAALRKDTGRNTFKLFFLAITILLFTHAIRWTWHLPRYYGASLPWLALLASQGLSYAIKNRQGWLQQAVCIWLGALLLFPNCALAAYYGLERVPYFFGFQSEETYIARHYPCAEGYVMMQYVLKNVLPDRKVLVLGVAPSPPYYYYYSHAIVPMAAFDVSLFKKTTREFAAFLVQHQIRYVLLSDTEFEKEGSDRLRYTTFSRVDCWIPLLHGPFFKLQYRTPQSTLYEVKGSN